LPDLTLVVPFYRNPSMLTLQFANWRGWSEKRKRRLRIILVDDGSPEPAADVPRPDGLPELEIYRVTEDRPWHQHGARNLGAHVAPEGWLLLTDMDHVLTDEAARALFKRIDRGELNKGRAYMLARIEADTGEPTIHPVSGAPKPHPNSFVMTRAKYWEVGGYDEDLCGHYGTDAAFRTRLGPLKTLPVPLTRYWRDIVPDASTVGLPRKEGREPGAIRKIIAAKAQRGEGPKVLDFPWERVL
jgi:hypothetical protein